MVDKTDKDKEQQALGRAAYGDAMSVLRENHRDEFDTLLDAAYEARGMVSPRKRRAERNAAAIAARAEAVVRREQKAKEKVARLKAELAAAEAAAHSAEFAAELATSDDPMSVFTQA